MPTVATSADGTIIFTYLPMSVHLFDYLQKTGAMSESEEARNMVANTKVDRQEWTQVNIQADRQADGQRSRRTVVKVVDAEVDRKE